MERQGVGIPGRDGLLHQIKQPQDDFRVAVRGTAPCFVPHYRGKPATPASYEVSLPSPTVHASPPPPAFYAPDPSPAFYASAPSTASRVKRATGKRATPAFRSRSASPIPQQVEKHTRPPFLEGEEDSSEIGLNDGKEVFIDDVLQTAEWCVP